MRDLIPKRRSNCPISHALDLFGDKWSLLVVRDLAFKQKCHFGEFLEGEEHVSTNILSDRLARLEATGLVEREPDPENGRKVVYRLTPRGVDLIPVLVEMILWSAKHDPKTAAERSFVRKARRDRESLIERLRGEVP